MKKDDFIYGCRSGIQKAVRRGDLDLAKTCFDTLWADYKQKEWIKWRLPILCFEETVHLVGELAEFMALSEVSEDDYRKFLYRITVATKSRDGHALRRYGIRHHNTNPIPALSEEFQLMQDVYDITAPKHDDPGQAASPLFEQLMELREYSDYEMAAMRYLRKRTGSGGMVGDRYFCLVAMILIYTRGSDKEAAVKDIRDGLVRWQKRANKKTPIASTTLPWYVFDMHTQAGKFAMNVFMKKYKEKFDLTPELFRELFFCLTSAYSPGLILPLKVDDFESITIMDNAWWIHAVRASLVDKTRDPKTLNKLWRTELEPQIKGLIGWALKKREEG